MRSRVFSVLSAGVFALAAGLAVGSVADPGPAGSPRGSVPVPSSAPAAGTDALEPAGEPGWQ